MDDQTYYLDDDMLGLRPGKNCYVAEASKAAEESLEQLNMQARASFSRFPMLLSAQTSEHMGEGGGVGGRGGFLMDASVTVQQNNDIRGTHLTLRQAPRSLYQ